MLLERDEPSGPEANVEIFSCFIGQELPSLLKVEVGSGYIIVTMVGSSFRTTYLKSPDAQELVQTERLTGDKDAPRARNGFESLA